MAVSAQGDQVLLRIIAELTARLDMMNLEFPQTPAMLTAPSVSLKDSSVQSLVGLGIEP